MAPPRSPLLPALGDPLVDLLDAAGVGISITVDRGDRLERLYVNRAAADLLGYGVDEVADMPPMLPVAADERDRVAFIARRARDTGAAPAPLTTALVARDGRRIPVELTFARTEYRGLPATIAFIRDVTDRAAIAAALRESEHRFRSLADEAPDSITVAADGRFVYANRAAAAALGYDEPDELIGKPVAAIVPSDELPRMRERMARALAGERLGPSEYTGIRKDGGRMTMEISSVRVAWDGRPALLGVGRDVSDRRRRQEEIIRASQLAAVGQLAAGVAHEINNPLTFVLLNLERIRRELAASPLSHLQQHVEDVIDGAERIRAVVGDLLSFARAPAAGRTPAPVDVVAVVDSALRLAGHALRRCARVERTVAAVPPVPIDRARLGQVVLNVLLNAADALDGRDPDSGHIAVRVTEAPPGAVEIAISDNGPGVAESDVDRVFEPFFTTKPAGRGTGLGLAICRTIVEAAGGSIALDSHPGTGTTVRIRLPTAREPKSGAGR
ncbi:MAG: PAS domain S-box protein [Deltaproteobacteria bacterium]|nr:MAG: PAS domain S-box protein [Deltaproteobacteria bacterium]